MELQILETTGKVAGIGGIALGVLVILFREALRKVVFPKMTREQGYRTVTLFLVMVWSVALAGIGAWVWTEVAPAGEGGQGGGTSISTGGDNSPVVTGVDGNVTINNN